MKKGVWFVALTLLMFGWEGRVFAYEGGAKLVVTMAQPEKGETRFGPVLVIPHDQLTPSKPVLRLLRLFPEPTLSIGSIREERPGRSLGTKAFVLFQKR